VRSRDLFWDGCLNVRDLGGHPTEDGGRTRFGSYVRADNIERLTENGWRALVDYGVRTVVDLRLEEERGVSPPAELPLVTLHRPLVPDFGHPDWEELDALSLGSFSPESTRIVYLEFLERYRDRFGEAISTIASVGDGGALLFHCMGGKDRTGLITALLLRVAGAERSAVAADYALSGRNLEAMHAAWIAAAADERERELRVRIAATPAEAMLGVLRTLDERYDGVEGYLRAAGVGDPDFAAVRTRLRE
jgi:protein tyrosine/serine phosphatase